MSEWLMIVALCLYASAYTTAVIRRGNRLVQYGGSAVVAVGYLVVLAPMTLVGHKSSWTRRTFGRTWTKFCTNVGKAVGEFAKAAVQAVQVIGQWSRWCLRRVRGLGTKSSVKVR